MATPDFYPFGDRIQPDHNGPGFEVRYNARFVTAMLYGFNLLALNTSDVIRLIDYLEKREDADVERLGCIGVSYGGTVTHISTVMDSRIKKATLCSSFGSYAGHGLWLDELCGAQVIPGILRLGDMAEVTGLIAPRPLLLEVSQNDPHFPWKYTAGELDRLKNIYRIFGCAQNLHIDVFQHGGHQYHGRMAKTFFDDLI